MSLTMAMTSLTLAAEPTVDKPKGIFGALATAAEWFIGIFQAGGETFVGLVTGIIPTLVVLLAGTVPFLSFVAERTVTRKTRAGERL